MMIQFVLVWILLCRLTTSKNVIGGYDFGQHYSRIRIFEYDGYSDVKFLKFNIYGPTFWANWSVTIEAEGKCANYQSNIHFDLQYNAYPLIAPRNETFPSTYISYRHDLLTTVFNRTLTNLFIQIQNPLIGTWFAMSFAERQSTITTPKIMAGSCNLYLTSWLDYHNIPDILTLTTDEQLRVIVTNSTTSTFVSYYTSNGNSLLTMLSEWTSACDILITARINALPSRNQFDYRTVCTNGSNSTCSIAIDQLAAFNWIYFQISTNDPSCSIVPIYGMMFLHSTKCSSRLTDETCIRSYPTRRIMFNYYYDFLYVPLYAKRPSSSTNMVTLNNNDSSIYSIEFVVDDRNLGGTIHVDFDVRTAPTAPLNANVSVLGCLSKYRPRTADECESAFVIRIEKNSLTVRSLPYPEMALWYLTLQHVCNDSVEVCANAPLSIILQISSSQCTNQQCGTYGVCRIMTSQQNVFSTCVCIAGYRGYGCTDGTYANVAKSLESVIFLTLSNLMFIPPIILALTRRLFIEALVYFFNMFFSTFYHACDQEIHKFCIFKYDGLQLSDFIGSYASFVITLITMAIIPRSVKAFLFMLGLLTCVIINSRDRFNTIQFVCLIGITFGFTVTTWVVVSVMRRRLHPSRKRLLLVLPGFLLALTGVILFAFCETDNNYWYVHSIWHILMATSILFFIPQKQLYKREQNEVRIRSSDTTTRTNGLTASSINVTNEAIVMPIDNTSLSSSSTDNSKKSTDELLPSH